MRVKAYQRSQKLKVTGKDMSFQNQKRCTQYMMLVRFSRYEMNERFNALNITLEQADMSPGTLKIFPTLVVN